MVGYVVYFRFESKKFHTSDRSDLVPPPPPPILRCSFHLESMRNSTHRTDRISDELFRRVVSVFSE